MLLSLYISHCGYFWTPGRRPESPINQLRMSVRTYVHRYIYPLRDFSQNWLISFWSRIQERWQSPIFRQHSSWPKFGQKGSKMAPKWPFSTSSQNSVITFGWKQAKMSDIMVRMYGTPSMSGKTLVGQILRKTAQKLSTNQIASFSKCYIF